MEIGKRVLQKRRKNPVAGGIRKCNHLIRRRVLDHCATTAAQRIPTGYISVLIRRAVKKSVVKMISDVAARLPSEHPSSGVESGHEVQPLAAAAVVEPHDQVGRSTQVFVGAEGPQEVLQVFGHQVLAAVLKIFSYQRLSRPGSEPGIFWLSFISLRSSAFDHLATVP